MTCVVDAPVAMAWCFEDEQNTYTESVLDSLSTETAVVPSPQSGHTKLSTYY